MIPIYFVQRTSDDGKQTFGKFLDTDRSQLCVTIERPWLDNQNQISCIPAGTYLFYKYNSPTKGWVWRTDQVPNRTAIEIHAANFASQLLGCIAVGASIGAIGDVPAVLSSQATLKMLQGVLPDQFNLIIEGV